MLPVMILGYEIFFLPRPGQEKKDHKTLLILTGTALVVFTIYHSWFSRYQQDLT